MSKDPAMLFYTSDFLVGTMAFTDEQVGKYIRLLCMQHQHGHLTMKEIMSILKNKDQDILSKFIEDERGLFYNERLEIESNKRKKYVKSRQNNLLGGSHMGSHMENVNEDVNINTKEKEKRFLPPTETEMIDFFLTKGFPETLAKRVYEYYSTANWKDSKGKPVLNWKQKCIAVWMKDENRETGNKQKDRVAHDLEVMKRMNGL